MDKVANQCRAEHRAGNAEDQLEFIEKYPSAFISGFGSNMKCIQQKNPDLFNEWYTSCVKSGCTTGR
jgi:hypothetical protein